MYNTIFFDCNVLVIWLGMENIGYWAAGVHYDLDSLNARAAEMVRVLFMRSFEVGSSLLNLN